MVLPVVTVQYNAQVLDGTTPAEPFSTIPGQTGFHEPNAQGIFEFNVPALGVFDPTLLGGGAFANRLIPWIQIFGPAFPASANNITTEEGDRPGVPLELVANIEQASRGINLRRCIMVPQTGVLALNGMVGDANDPVMVRMKVWVPTTNEDYAAMKQACCCRAGLPQNNLEAVACDLAFISLFPTNIAEGSPGTTAVIIDGAGFTPDIQVSFLRTVPSANALVIDSIIFLNDTRIRVILAQTPIGSAGTYDLVMTNPNVPGCALVAEGAFTVT